MELFSQVRSWVLSMFVKMLAYMGEYGWDKTGAPAAVCDVSKLSPEEKATMGILDIDEALRELLDNEAGLKVRLVCGETKLSGKAFLDLLDKAQPTKLTIGKGKALCNGRHRLLSARAAELMGTPIAMLQPVTVTVPLAEHVVVGVKSNVLNGLAAKVSRLDNLIQVIQAREAKTCGMQMIDLKQFGFEHGYRQTMHWAAEAVRQGGIAAKDAADLSWQENKQIAEATIIGGADKYKEILAAKAAGNAKKVLDGDSIRALSKYATTAKSSYAPLLAMIVSGDGKGAMDLLILEATAAKNAADAAK